MDSMNDLASALTERTAAVDSILALPPVVLSHVLAFCNGRDFDTLGQLSRCVRLKHSTIDIPGWSSRQRTQSTTFSLFCTAAITGRGKLSCDWNTTTRTE
jgi:hypothetical protein